jgi:hypothetical protein
MRARRPVFFSRSGDAQRVPSSQETSWSLELSAGFGWGRNDSGHDLNRGLHRESDSVDLASIREVHRIQDGWILRDAAE